MLLLASCDVQWNFAEAVKKVCYLFLTDSLIISAFFRNMSTLHKEHNSMHIRCAKIMDNYLAQKDS